MLHFVYNYHIEFIKTFIMLNNLGDKYTIQFKLALSVIINCNQLTFKNELYINFHSNANKLTYGLIKEISHNLNYFQTKTLIVLTINKQ